MDSQPTHRALWTLGKDSMEKIHQELFTSKTAEDAEKAIAKIKKSIQTAANAAGRSAFFGRVSADIKKGVAEFEIEIRDKVSRPRGSGSVVTTADETPSK